MALDRKKVNYASAFGLLKGVTAGRANFRKQAHAKVSQCGRYELQPLKGKPEVRRLEVVQFLVS